MSTAKTPMMRQYEAIKAAHPGFLLFYRMGDFYELFADDAIEASAILQITLTSRRSSKEGDKGVPMCGVPFHAAEGYIAQLIKAGKKVALCEQTETPAQAKARDGAKALVNREVIRMYTGGTLTEDSMLPSDANNYLAAIASKGKDIALSWLDLSTGEFFATPVTEQNLEAQLSRLNPGEVLVDKEYDFTNQDFPLTAATDFFNNREAERSLKATFAVSDLTALGLTNSALITACGAVLNYAELTQLGKLPALRRVQVMQGGHYLHIDSSSRRNLELTETLHGEKQGSLLAAINHTITPAGGRLLNQWLTAPLTDVAAIIERQQGIVSFINNAAVRAEVRDTLKQTADLARSLARLTLSRGGPRDLAAVRQTLQQLPQLQSLIAPEKDTLLEKVLNATSGLEPLTELLNKAIELENLPLLARDGGFVQSGFCAQLDEFRSLSKNGMELLQALEAREAERTGIANLRIKYNKVWGYFLEVINSQKSRVPDDYIHRQTTTNNQRFTTAALMELEQNFSAAEANMLAREQQLFDELVTAVCKQSERLLSVAEALATVDVLSAGAELATKHNYVRPVVDSSNEFKIEAGRHPVVATTVDKFIANNCELSNNQLWLVTGPNMAGKSTFLRQNALLTIMAQMGYFVPAKAAHIGVVDKIFTRIGAGDDLARGQSTFMVEMVETATILNNATDRSLVILDEIGRGTATYDGLSIAWGCVEHLVKTNKCRGLFATHYHEMTVLEEQLPKLSCHHVAVKEWQNEIVFLHEVKVGSAPRSYGIHVGKLAGLPPQVVARAQQILQGLEKSSGGKAGANSADLPLFMNAAEPITVEVIKPSAVEEELAATDPDSLTPRQAQELVYKLSELLK